MRHLFQFGNDLLEPFLEVTAIARAGQEAAHVERIDHRLGQHFGHFAFDDLARQAFGDGRLAHARIAHVERVVLGTAAQDLDRAVNLGTTADQRIDLAQQSLVVEVDAELVERGILLVAALRLGLFLLLGGLFLARLGRAGIDLAAALADAVADIADGIQAAHVLLLEEIDGIGIAFGEQRDQHVGPRDGVLARRLDMQDRALDHALEPGGRLGIGLFRGLEGLVFLVEVLAYHVAQIAKVHAAGLHHLRCVCIVDQGKQEMFERRVFMAALRGIGQGAVQRLFEALGETGHRLAFWGSLLAMTEAFRHGMVPLREESMTLVNHRRTRLGGRHGCFNRR